MKKRLISILLTVLMVMSLFSGMSLSAYAATTSVLTADTIQYTMAEGDFVLRICQRLGLNYYTCKQAIMILNNINDSQWNKLPVGKVLTLPASDADAVLISTGKAVTGASAVTTNIANAITTTPTTTTTAGTTTVSGKTNTDGVACYLIPYTMSSGETVSGVCNNLGVNFAAHADLIKRVNDISNWKKIKAGDTLLLPIVYAPAIGTSCYAVLQHIVASGETAYTICNNNGVNYGGMTKMLKALNGDNLASIQVGQKFYYPVATLIAANDSVGKTMNGNTSSNPTGVAEDSTAGVSTTTKPDGTVVKNYKLTSNIHSAIGTMIFYVDGKVVNNAPAGVPVTVQLTLETGSALDGMVIKHADGSADTQLTGDTFIMPACDVRVDVNIKNGHNIKINANYPTLAITTVGGVAVNSATKGSAVMISSLDPTYAVTEAYVNYKTLTGNKKEAITNLSKGFVMPDADVVVDVVLKPVATYDFYVVDADHGSYFLAVNNSRVTKAARGAQVTIVTQPAEGYTASLKTLAVRKADGTPGTAISYFNNSFTMPASDVIVEVEFVSKGNNIIVNPVQGGAFFATLNKAATDPEKDGDSDGYKDGIDEAATKAKVYILPDTTKAVAGYTASTKATDYIVTRNSDGLKVTVSMDGGVPCFVMPAGGVTITGAFTTNAIGVMGEVYIDGTLLTKYTDASFYVSAHDKRSEFKTSGEPAFMATYGEYIELTYDCADSLTFDHYEVSGSATDGELADQANMHGYILLDDGTGSLTKITVKAYFESGKVGLGDATVIGAGSVSYELDGKSVGACKPGETNLNIILNPGDHYTFDDLAEATPAFAKLNQKLQVKRKDTGGSLTLGAPTVITTADGSKAVKVPIADAIPAEGISVTATFDPLPYVLTLKTSNMNGKDLTGKGLWSISVNGGDPIVDNGVTKVDVNFGDGVVMSLTEAGKDNYDVVSFKVDGAEYTSPELNYNYNFRMIEDRAKNMTVEAILREKNPVSDAFNLYANYDNNRGSVEFVIRHSDTNPPSATNPYVYDVTYVKSAHAGDTVALVPSSGTGFQIDIAHVAIDNGDAGIIYPVEVTLASGKTGYEFTMPSTNVFANIWFYGIPYPVTLNVVDVDGVVTDLVTKGYVQVSTDGENYKSVNDPNSIGQISYGEMVYVTTTPLAQNEGWSITSITGVPVATIWNGFQFKMPNAATTLTINMKKDSTATALPLSQYTNPGQGSLAFYKDAACTQIITEAMPGDTVYVKATVQPGFQMVPNSLHVLNVADATMIETAVSPNVWSFEMPGYGIQPVTCSFEALKYNVAVKLNPAATEGVTITYNNTKTVPVKDGDTILDAEYNTGLSVMVPSGKVLKSFTYQVNSDPAVSVPGGVFTIPAAPAGATITVTITLA